MVASWETKGSIDDQRATFMSKLMIDKLTTENHLKGIKGVLIKGYVSKESRQMMPEPVEVELALACEDLVEAIKDILEKEAKELIHFFLADFIFMLFKMIIFLTVFY